MYELTAKISTNEMFENLQTTKESAHKHFMLYSNLIFFPFGLWINTDIYPK